MREHESENSHNELTCVVNDRTPRATSPGGRFGLSLASTRPLGLVPGSLDDERLALRHRPTPYLHMLARELHAPAIERGLPRPMATKDLLRCMVDHFVHRARSSAHPSSLTCSVSPGNVWPGASEQCIRVGGALCSGSSCPVERVWCPTARRRPTRWVSTQHGARGGPRAVKTKQHAASLRAGLDRPVRWPTG